MNWAPLAIGVGVAWIIMAITAVVFLALEAAREASPVEQAEQALRDQAALEAAIVAQLEAEL